MSLARKALQYLGVNAVNPPDFIKAGREPTTSDTAYAFGFLWLDTSGNKVFMHAGGGTWIVLGVGTNEAIRTLTGDSGGAITADSSQNVDLIGTSADGVTVAGSAGQLQWGISAASTSQRGTLETATDGEADAAASSVVALVPSNLAALTADNLAALSSSDAQAQAMSSSSVYVTPANLAALRDGTNLVFTQNPLLQANANTGAAPVGTDTATNIMALQDGEIMEVYNIGTQTIIAPRMAAAGLLVSLDLTDDEGCEYNWGVNANSKHAYTVGTDPAVYLEWQFTLADVTGCDPVGIGFRKQEANNSTLESYTDFAWIGVSESDTSAFISLKTRLNSGAVTTTDTTDAWADGETHTLAVLVDGSGNVTYTIDGSAPTATAAFQFDTGDVIMPFFHGLHGTTSPGAWHWVSCKAGLQ